MRSITLLASALFFSNAAFAWPTPATLGKRAAGGDRVNYTDPNSVGGQMLTIIPDLDVGEPINAIVSGLSDESVLTVEGFLLWVTSIHFGVSCYGNADGGGQYASLGAGKQIQGTGDGNNGVLRWNYYQPYFGTCLETFRGGNHFRWFQQESSGAFFLAVSNEEDLSQHHMIQTNGYNTGRDEMVANATLSNGTQWDGNVYQTTVDWIEAGVLLNATSDGVNHPSVALPGQPTQDGRVALLTIRQLASGKSRVATSSASGQFSHSSHAPLVLSMSLAAGILLFATSFSLV